MTDLDLAGMWRTMRVHPADVPRVGARPLAFTTDNQSIAASGGV
jgi:hypothetical protein